jgi:hypothetical protein
MDPVTALVGVEEERVEGKLAFKMSIASSMRPERMLV